MPLNFNMLLQDEGIHPDHVRLLRHQTGKVPGRTPYTLWRDDVGAFQRYQSTQDPTRQAYFDAPFWAAFVAPPSGGTLFVGLYEVQLIGKVPVGQIDPLTLREVGADKGIGPYDQYDCRPVLELSEYVGRLFVHWGDSTSSFRAWVQRAERQNKEIVELTKVFQEESFPGFTKFIRPLSEIETMPISWKEVLTANRGVYLLACPKTREHYVGSASGGGGFLGRWRDYVANNHGGNAGLKSRDPADLQVSILEVSGSAAAPEEILALEDSWKAKLLSRTIGLNRN
ncbi:GIY-YIG nuclease family protein [Porphyrobacter algicida]|uniref:GIY-YIG nuclease family protein n=1 Tax=Qipengyuania algicida TaxID=1836209 RepID=A0A845AGV4_9SPHN|nr:GIY-YIG nuclease family protein [Qipengyuania algicida]MXP28874.1 GIY-YIG nuclease family protein [Qipengyuania algicida]